MGQDPGPKETYDHHLADVPTAELRIGRVVHIDHPAAHEDAQPDQQDILDPEAWEPALLREGSGEEVPIITKGSFHFFGPFTAFQPSWHPPPPAMRST